jgi:hypothetical protein
VVVEEHNQMTAVVAVEPEVIVTLLVKLYQRQLMQ